jgi:NADH:ubiquinone oxidoreductase subunit F (NADH-binding)
MKKLPKMQILRRTDLRAFALAKKQGSNGVIKILIEKGLSGRGGAGFSTGKKWEDALATTSDEKFVVCNADEGEPGTFKDKFIIKNNPGSLIEGIMIAALTIKAKQAFIYLRKEYEYLKPLLDRTSAKLIRKSGQDLKIDVFLGGGAYVCGEETAIIRSIEGFRGQPYCKPPFPHIEGLWGKPTIVDNVETFANVPQAILFNNWDKNLRLMSVSGNVTKPGVYELPVGAKLTELVAMCEPENKVKAIYSGCFGGCFPYQEIQLTPENICGLNCIIGAYTLIVVDENQSIIDTAISISKFYEFESCGKCTPCREGTKRVLDLLMKIKDGKAIKDDLDTLHDLAGHIHETALCGLGQTATNHIITALKYFREEFEEKIHEIIR